MQVIPDVKGSKLVSFVKGKVLPKSVVYTDELPSYDHLPELSYVHRRMNHAAKVHTNGDIHKNSIEGFWSLVNRGIDGVYHAVSKKYLQDYLNDYAFRYNRRDNAEAMFGAFLSSIETSAETRGDDGDKKGGVGPNMGADLI